VKLHRGILGGHRTGKNQNFDRASRIAGVFSFPKAIFLGANFSASGGSRTRFGKGKGRISAHMADLQREQNSTGGVQSDACRRRLEPSRKGA
jgi:hypothetical protein